MSERETLKQLDSSAAAAAVNDDENTVDHNASSLSAVSETTGQQSSIVQHMYVA